MSSIVIVSGCPGSGKTTLAESLARFSDHGLHFLSDVFYRFPASPIHPARAEARHQNTVIMRALARSAQAFADGGYHVVLDGIIGPWFLPVFREELAGALQVSYLVLRVSEAEALRRVRERQGSGASATVRQLLSEFAELGSLSAHAVDTEDMSPEQVLAEARSGLRAGRFLLRW
jgi:predicted kinase